MEQISNEELIKKLQTNDKEGLSSQEAKTRLQRDGKNALEEKKETFLQKLIPYFWGPIPWMIEAAMLLSLITQDYRDFIIILVMLLLNAYIGWKQDKSAQDALSELKKDLALKATVLRDGKWVEIESSNIVVGDIVSIKFGNIVPADGQILSNDYLKIDQSALTGESLPVTKGKGEVIYSGSIVKEGAINAIITATGKNTFFGKTAQLVSKAGASSHLTAQITSVGNTLIFGALILSAILVVFQLANSEFSQNEIIKIVKTVLVLIVATIPVAMPAVISVTIALGALTLSKKKAIVSKLNSIEALASVDILCSDKTGTLTQNKLSVADVFPFKENSTKDEIILFGVLASDPKGNDVIDIAIQRELEDKSKLNQFNIEKLIPFDPVSKKIQVDVKQDNKEFSIIKGAPQVILDFCKLQGEELMEASSKIDELASHGFKSLGVAQSFDKGETWKYLGVFSLADPLREDSKQTVQDLQEHEISVKMITGDSQNIAKEIASQLGIGDNILKATSVFGDDEDKKLSKEELETIQNASGFAQVFPQHKYAIVKNLQEAGHVCAMTGDGVNDSPALKQADCGIAVSGATDAARAAASLILLDPGLGVIKNAISEAKRIFARMMSYIYYRIAMTVNIMVLSVIVTLVGSHLITKIEPTASSSYFPLTAIMLVLLALLDDIPIMTIAYDNTKISKGPAIWNGKKIFSLSFILGFVSVIQSLLLLVWINGSFSSVWDSVTSFEQIQTILFLQLVVGGHLLLLITRRDDGWFFLEPYPHPKLLTAIISTQLFVVVLCYFGIFVNAIDGMHILYIWIYNIIWMFILSFISITVTKFQNK